MYTEGLIMMSLICKIVYSIRTNCNPKKALKFIAFQVILITVLTILYIIVFKYVLGK